MPEPAHPAGDAAAGISTLAIARSAQPSRMIATSAMSQSCA